MARASVTRVLDLAALNEADDDSSSHGCLLSPVFTEADRFSVAQDRLAVATSLHWPYLEVEHPIASNAISENWRSWTSRPM